MATAVSSVNPVHQEQRAPAPSNHGSGDKPEPLPTAAQINLQSFNLPDFPERASGLRSLTLTSDIKPTEYADLLNPSVSTATDPNISSSSSSSIPQGIEALTLELFSLGYPPLWLGKLAKALPKLKSLTLFSQLVDGVSDSSRSDSGEFFNKVLVGNKENGGGLRELHLLDVFCRKGFMAGLGDILEDLHESGTESHEGKTSSSSSSSKSVLRFLEVSYTYRGHSDSNFSSRIPSDELPTMLVPSLIAASFSLAPPITKSSSDEASEFPDDPADVDENGVPIPGRKPEGIIPLPQASLGVAILMKKLTGKEEYAKQVEEAEEKAKATKGDTEGGEHREEKDGGEEEEDPSSAYRPGSGPGPRNLKMLDATIYTLDTDQLADIVQSQQGLAVLSASILVSGTSTTSKTNLVNALRGGKDGSSGKDLEIVEIVGVPDDQEVSEPVPFPLFRHLIQQQRRLIINTVKNSPPPNLPTRLPRRNHFTMSFPLRLTWPISRPICLGLNPSR
jgi:hypothetical protein